MCYYQGDVNVLEITLSGGNCGKNAKKGGNFG